MDKTLENLKKTGKPNWGGSRTGSGRKPRQQFEAREDFYNSVDDRMEKIWEILDIHIRRGDKSIIMWLLDQRLGRPAQNQMVDVTSKSVSYNFSDSLKKVDGIDIMEIAKGVTAELKRLKT